MKIDLKNKDPSMFVCKKSRYHTDVNSLKNDLQYNVLTTKFREDLMEFKKLSLNTTRLVRMIDILVKKT